jgi:hypothetical protein
MTALADDAPRGFVPMRDYLRLQAECDELREQIADLRPARKDPRIARICRAIRTSPQRASILLVLWLAREPLPGIRLAKRVGTEHAATLSRQVLSLRPELRNAGAPANMIQSRRWHGYWLTDEGRAWLQERVPEAFQTRGTP